MWISNGSISLTFALYLADVYMESVGAKVEVKNAAQSCQMWLGSVEYESAIAKLATRK